jgi:phosphoheptose isomerase
VLSDDFFTPGSSSDPVHEVKGFAHQLQMLGRPGDIVLGFGNAPCASKRLVRAFEAVREIGLYCVFIGSSEDEIAQYADLTIPVPASEPERACELQMESVHLLCKLLVKRWRSGRRPHALGKSASWPPSEFRAAEPDVVLRDKPSLALET